MTYLHDIHAKLKQYHRKRTLQTILVVEVERCSVRGMARNIKVHSELLLCTSRMQIEWLLDFDVR